MKESPFGFEYTWADLQPVRALAITVLVTQLVGAIAGVATAWHSDWFMNLWIGGALSTFPAFLVGLFIQSKLTPGRLGEHKVMVRRFGLIALALSVFAVAIPALGLFNAP